MQARFTLRPRIQVLDAGQVEEIHESTLRVLSDVGLRVNEDMTLGLFREAYYRSQIFPHLTLEAWQRQGCPQAMRVLRRHTQQLLEQARPPADHAQLLAQGEEFIERLRRRC